MYSAVLAHVSTEARAKIRQILFRSGLHMFNGQPDTMAVTLARHRISGVHTNLRSQ